MKRKSMLFS